ncbi:HU family DNA-binding protein [Mycoplasma sp. Ms02]|uniref:HU family DNA-binding protein n=1 Tax=Mycoplasma sp. Ms02 TaxID=353851 RepID=UPI001C89CDF9|nr:HU family DNA-binding protein [Mycoplasma sp. Ms02]QZE12574.1 HU family DNA-binding protein [Mycoplasma sp. Ms02]
MTKKEFVTRIAERIDVPVKKAEQFLDAFVFILKEELIAEEKVQLSDLGTFSTQIKRGRTTKNAFTGELLEIPEKRVVKYKPSKYLRELVDF